MINQFAPAQIEKKYTVELDKPAYKAWRRLMSLGCAAEVHLFLDQQGRIQSLKVFSGVKEEILLGYGGEL